MAREDLVSIISRALTDEEFRQDLINNIDDVLAQYNLDIDEQNILRKLDADSFDELASDLGSRLSKSGFFGGLSLMGGKDKVDSGAILDILSNKFGGK